ncbi:hypothetical protein GCM10010193_70100 [Kitasatospora atroaurantiaca]|uniref:Uncharacterized protein DUF4326 n=1 Tax=Kitasatospora atroaurantiaca TaxID=285545 RepID=A0A561ENA4_9ACTN|nr:DUF4326 domain-containing protein [Kitasatospora atroaurantiaca]TWE17096.1 uncharacterized protein DUF4326 [Kitasatospora atroaurantiaca]
MTITLPEPHRIQRRRVKGWRAPEGVVYVGRGTKWGNPWAYRTPSALARVPALDGAPWEHEGRIKAPKMHHAYCHPDGRTTHHFVRHMTRAECVEMYRQALTAPTDKVHVWHGTGLPWLTAEDVSRELAGRDLMCWCPPTAACHADVLLELANPAPTALED